MTRYKSETCHPRPSNLDGISSSWVTSIRHSIYDHSAKVSKIRPAFEYSKSINITYLIFRPECRGTQWRCRGFRRCCRITALHCPSLLDWGWSRLTWPSTWPSSYTCPIIRRRRISRLCRCWAILGVGLVTGSGMGLVSVTWRRGNRAGIVNVTRARMDQTWDLNILRLLLVLGCPKVIIRVSNFSDN